MEIRGFPTLKYLRDGQYYTFKQKRSIEAWKEFALDGGYLKTVEEHTGTIPVRLEGFEKYKKMFFDVAKELQKGIDSAFDKWFFLRLIPSIIMYLLCLLMVCGPGIVMIIVLFQEDEEEPASATTAAAKPAAASKKVEREKMD